MLTPEYMLLSATTDNQGSGHWRFILRSLAGSDIMEVAEQEPGVHGDRLALLAVIRGLEALEQPSQVRVVTSSRYVRRGISFGLATWRKNGWTWESYGRMAPIKNQDLWLRMDRAVQIHEVCCWDVRRTIRLDSAHQTIPRPRIARAKVRMRLGSQAGPQREDEQQPMPAQAAAQKSKNRRKTNLAARPAPGSRKSQSSQPWQLSFA